MSDGAEDRGDPAASSGWAGMQCEVVPILMGKGRDILVAEGRIERRRSRYKYCSSMVLVVIALRRNLSVLDNQLFELLSKICVGM